MARKISTLACQAFWDGRTFNQSNTTVAVDNDGTVKMYLHGNLIAERSNHHLKLYSRGWYTLTTKERLNVVLQKTGRFIRQVKGEWYVLSPHQKLEWKEGLTIPYTR